MPFRKSIAQWMNQLYGQGMDRITNRSESWLKIFFARAGTNHLRSRRQALYLPVLGQLRNISRDKTSKARDCELSSRTKYKLTPELLRQNLNNKSRLLILNSPNNPTGSDLFKGMNYKLYTKRFKISRFICYL